MKHGRAEPYASPLRAPDLSNLPPCADRDGGVRSPKRDEGEAYADALAAAGNEAQARCSYDGVVHDFFATAVMFECSRQGFEETIEGLQKTSQLIDCAQGRFCAVHTDLRRQTGARRTAQVRALLTTWLSLATMKCEFAGPMLGDDEQSHDRLGDRDRSSRPHRRPGLRGRGPLRTGRVVRARHHPPFQTGDSKQLSALGSGPDAHAQVADQSLKAICLQAIG